MMTNNRLNSLDITNFRSIRGSIHVPLDAQVVLVHGENGAGKTSLLSAIELALTGGVQALSRADPDYAVQLLHRGATKGRVAMSTENNAAAQLFSEFTDMGIVSSQAFEAELAAVFSERSYLPQALLGQLLQIYQDSGEGADSPLARFVGELLRLDRLDALEAGLKPLLDVRNVRKVTDQWSEMEFEKNRAEKLLKEQQKERATASQSIARALEGIRDVLVTLGLSIAIDEENFSEAAVALRGSDEDSALARLKDQQRELASIERRILEGSLDAGSALVSQLSDAERAFERWGNVHASDLGALRKEVEDLLPDAIFSAPFDSLIAEIGGALALLDQELSTRRDNAQAAQEGLTTAKAELELATQRLAAIDEQLQQIPATPGGLAGVLSELSAFVDGDMCPVCERDFSETGKGALADHVHAKVKTLSASAERMLGLGRSRSETQQSVVHLKNRIASLEAVVLSPKAFADLERKAELVVTLRARAAGMDSVAQEGATLLRNIGSHQRAQEQARTWDVAMSLAQEALAALATSLGQPSPSPDETMQAVVQRLNEDVRQSVIDIEKRVLTRKKLIDLTSGTQNLVDRRKLIDQEIKQHQAEFDHAVAALRRAQAIRDDGLKVRSTVDTVRSSIIRREFNDRLNHLWRDLFIRLAPGEPFIPAFRIPEGSTQRLQPKLVTEHRDGGSAGGTPGAMLSAGNLNTAALTLFLALHLSVPEALPWLILDDPVQSMDDVHIAHLAALMRTLSKEHGRQIIVAVHDRQLFDYLRLELSPAYPGDSLLTLELSRSNGQDTQCLPRRLGYRAETALKVA